MTREELEHAIRAACDVANDDAIYVFGSQAILGQFPDAPEELRMSAEIDVSPRSYPERVDRIDGALGELSAFHDAFGFYVHGVPMRTSSRRGTSSFPASTWRCRWTICTGTSSCLWSESRSQALRACSCVRQCSYSQRATPPWCEHVPRRDMLKL